MPAKVATAVHAMDTSRPSQPSTPSLPPTPSSIPRRPSPWHEIAHSLASVSPHPSTPPYTPPTDTSSHVVPSSLESDSALSASVGSSIALREWERALAAPDSDVTRHALVVPSDGSPLLLPSVPKLAAEMDKAGHIEYKLKLIEPSADRFERLVTQMMWRLKQGRNEAIYELGLADDGTVIGLTRAEMDASLATLERMASEVGATVLVLKEIVLAAQPRRPDLDENGKPRRGTKSIASSGPEMRSRRERLRIRREAEANAAAAGETLPPDHSQGGKRIIFDDSDYDSGADSRDSHDETFTLDMESPPPASPRQDEDAAVRAEAKRRKSAARREARRLDLLRGDGTSPIAEIISHAPSSPAWNLHQPVKPSSLRLARGAADEGLDDAFVDTLSLPLDSLSLSFADVRGPEGDGEELICVEALVVCKRQEWEDEWGGEEDGWGFGGEDVWGLGEAGEEGQETGAV